jgi:hypothetical protein
LNRYGYNRGTAPAADVEALGDYYGRVAAWYMRGAFTDEYGLLHSSGRPPLPITRWEVGNEVDYEHGHTAASYTVEYDAIVKGIWRMADGNKSLLFSGLALPNIDDVDKVEAWARFFLNASNHDADVQKSFGSAVAAIGYHAYPTTPPYNFTKDPVSLQQVFDYVDDVLLPKVQRIDAVIAGMAPHVRTWLDECGLDMDQVMVVVVVVIVMIIVIIIIIIIIIVVVIVVMTMMITTMTTSGCPRYWIPPSPPPPTTRCIGL